MIAIDCETSGLDFQKHQILSIGAIDMESLQKGKRREFYGECYLEDNKTWEKEALTVNGFTEADLKNKTKKSLKELMQDFYNWIQECEEYTIMGQNVFFDKYFLEDSFKSSGIDFRFPHRIVDIHTLAFYVAKSKGVEIEIKNKKMNFSLRNIAMMLSLPTEPFPHNALTGAKYDAEIYIRLVSGETLNLI